MFFPRGRVLFLAIMFAFTARGIWPQRPDAISPPALTAAQIVDEMQRHSQARTDGLKHLKSIRQYQVEYRGFSAVIAAHMEVEYNYDAALGKSFRIVKQSGSKMLCERVLKRALESEMEASQDKVANALTPANYRFHLAGTENLGGGRLMCWMCSRWWPANFCIKAKSGWMRPSSHC